MLLALKGDYNTLQEKNRKKSSGNIIIYALFIYIIPTIRNYHGEDWNKKTPLIHIERLYIKIIGHSINIYKYLSIKKNISQKISRTSAILSFCHSINIYKSIRKLKKIKEHQQSPRNLPFFVTKTVGNFHLETTLFLATENSHPGLPQLWTNHGLLSLRWWMIYPAW